MRSQSYVVLLSSDQREKYVEDIFSAVALPQGATMRFRYEAKYLPPDLLQQYGQDYTSPFMGLVCFKGTFESQQLGIVPVRWVKVYRVRRVLDFFVFYFEVLGFPSFSAKFREAQGSTIASCTSEYYSQIPAGLAGLPVLTSPLGYVESTESTSKDSWLEIVRELSKHTIFRGTHFLRVNSLSGLKTIEAIADERRFVFTEGTDLQIETEFYASTQEGTSLVSLIADSESVRTLVVGYIVFGRVTTW
jgi:hypothetical protein